MPDRDPAPSAAAEERNKPGVLFLFRGPQTDIQHEVGRRLRLLSPDFCGLAVVPGYEEQSLAIGDFQVWSPAFERRNTIGYQRAYLREIGRRAREWERQSGCRIRLIGPGRAPAPIDLCAQLVEERGNPLR